mmetsp:Transcript_18475/g.54911  ORF Transcript_18475/g.54911 Transcript_18475/m.54911 type:complete len:371 (-) Transcript_18475:72-1184(-)
MRGRVCTLLALPALASALRGAAPRRFLARSQPLAPNHARNALRSARPPAPVAAQAQALDENSISGDTFLGALYKFCRPHTIRGTMLASFAGVAKALADSGGLAACWSWSLVPKALAGLVALMCGNAFIVGINQLYDVEVDQVNKPFLPIAAGELSPRTAKRILALCAVTGPAIVFALSPPLLVSLYMFGTAVGTAYSVPPFALKSRGPLFAGLAIACCRGFLLNFGVYYAVLDALGRPFRWNPGVAFMARFMTVFAAVIAVTKDLPDVAGDEKYGVETLATKIGVGKVAAGATLALGLNYASAVAQGLLAPAGWFVRRPMVAGHAILGAMLARNFRRYRKAGAEDGASIKAYYKSIWDLFYLEYVLYVFM